MKKIIIVAWIRSMNYGTLLQAYALDSFIKNNWGDYYECYEFRGRGKMLCLQNFYDCIHNITHPFKLKIMLLIKKKHGQHQYIDNDKRIKLKEERINSFIRANFSYLEINSGIQLRKLVERGSIFLVGSDQLWNPYYLHDTKLLHFVPPEYGKISYATSMGVKSLPPQLIKKYSYYLRRFDGISVREVSAKELLEKEIGRQDIEVVLDPTFLLTKGDWKNFGGNSKIVISKDKHYMVSYFVGEQRDYRDDIKYIQSKLNYNIVNLSCGLNKREMYGKTYVEAGPYEFVYLIENAELICTDSFHATALAINMNKDFIVFKRFQDEDVMSQNSRVEALLEKFRLLPRLVNSRQDIDNSIMDHIDFNFVNLLLKTERQKAYMFLKRYLK